MTFRTSLADRRIKKRIEWIRIFTKNVGCMALIKPRKSRFSLAIHRESLKEGELKSSFTTKKNQNF